jgi:hypothetical protein
MADKENTFKCPTFMYGPKGEAQIFTDSNDVPKGWAESPAAAKAGAGDDGLPMTRDEIVAALKAGSVSFKASASTEKLYLALGEAVKGHLSAQDIAFPDDASVPDLMKLLPV